MKLLAVVLLYQALAVPQQVQPVLEFPEAGIDNPAAFEGYRTRFYRDAADNTLQVYINQRDGRVVDVWANAANESLGFTVRDGSGAAAPLAWGAGDARVESDGARRSVEYPLQIGSPVAEIGHFVLESMRVERDFQYSESHREPFDAPPFPRPELATLIENLERLEPAERQAQLALLGAANVAQLRARLRPTLSLDRARTESRVRVEQPSFDGRNRLLLELRVSRADGDVRVGQDRVSIRSRTGGPIPLRVRVSTDAEPLTPLRHTEIFNDGFLSYFEELRAERDSVAALPASTRSAEEEDRLLRFRRTERQVRSLELLSSHEKLMAGLPNYGTYFGRDMLMSALMMEPVWTSEMAEYVIGSVLGKLAASGEVSHEEALGGQAIRENAAAYNRVMAEHFQLRAEGRSAAADSSLMQAQAILSSLQRVRENYHMMDDDFQFPVYVARYLRRPDVDVERKRAFLLAPVAAQDGATRLELLLRNLAYVTRMAQPYVDEPSAANLIAFPPRTETAWFPGSWRDSNAGYANGRFAMDINVVWVPAALQATGEILDALRELGLADARSEFATRHVQTAPLAGYLRDPAALDRALQAWNGTARHFAVELSAEEARARLQAKLASLPEAEAQYWSDVVQRGLPTEGLRFLALSLDADARPIPVLSTDVGMRLFIEDADQAPSRLSTDEVLTDVRSVMLPYPVGLSIPGIGPVVANDAYASPEVWAAFERDHYHSPRVVWGREVNLLLLGLARQIQAASDTAGAAFRPELEEYVSTLSEALHATREAVEASGLVDQELWSYRVEDGRLLPVRYASSTDLQLWNLTALAVQFQLEQLAEAAPALASP